MSMILAQGLRKPYGDVKALDGFSLDVQANQIMGLIGPNGSGKTTALKAILGMLPVDADALDVLGFSPSADRARMMQEVAYIADTGILPKWMRVRDLLRFLEGVHPRFALAEAQERLSLTDIHLDKRIGTLSKGMHVQLHLAIVLSMDARLLVLDEPTLGLDILHRQQFYDALLKDFVGPERSILVTTHEVREIEDILSDVAFIHRGRNILSSPTRDLSLRFTKLVGAESVDLVSRAVSVKETGAGSEYIFDGVEREALRDYGKVSTPNLAELFVALTATDNPT